MLLVFSGLKLGTTPGLRVHAGFQNRLPGRPLFSVIEGAALGHLQQAAVHIAILPAICSNAVDSA